MRAKVIVDLCKGVVRCSVCLVEQKMSLGLARATPAEAKFAKNHANCGKKRPGLKP